MSRSTELGLGDTYGQLDEAPVRCTDCSEESVFGFETCGNGRCPTCCGAESCHVLCTRCHRRVDGTEVCSCCGRCDLHDCKRDEDRELRIVWAEAKGDEQRDERAVGGAL